jgi:hypothetical protein
MRRVLLAIALLPVVGWLAWEYVPLRITVWDGAFDLTVYVDSAPGEVRSVRCEVVPNRRAAEEALYSREGVGSGPWSAVADPFTGKPLVVPVRTSGHDSPSGRAIRLSQFRCLVVTARMEDGRRVDKVAEIPDEQATHEMHLALP